MYKTADNTLFTGKNIVFVPTCDSTNDLALRLLQQTNPAEGTVVITNNQTAGRGQRGNTWQAAPGENLTFSLILKPTFLEAMDQFCLTMVTALGLYDFLSEQSAIQVQIKWPNDLLVEGKKTGGILIENQLKGKHLQSTVIGIGLNINQDLFELPKATSLKLLTGKHYLLEDVLHAILGKLEARYLMLRQGKKELLLSAYLKLMFQVNQVADYEIENKICKGIIRGVDAIGRLQIEIDSQLRTFDLKEIKYL